MYVLCLFSGVLFSFITGGVQMFSFAFKAMWNLVYCLYCMWKYIHEFKSLHKFVF